MRRPYAMESPCKPVIALVGLLVLLVGPVPSVRGQYKLPDAFPTCHRGKPGLDECLTDAVQKAMQYLVTGDEGLNAPPLDPLKINNMDIEQQAGPVRLKLHFDNLLMSGLKDAFMESVTTDLDNFRINNHMLVKGSITLEGNYSMDGRILVLPVSGSGWCQITLSDLVSDINLVGSEEIRDGQKYMKVDAVNLNFETNRLFVNFHNLFNGDKRIGATTNQFLNDNWREIMREFKPTIQAAFASTFRDVARVVFDKVPFDQIFPD